MLHLFIFHNGNFKESLHLKKKIINNQFLFTESTLIQSGPDAIAKNTMLNIAFDE